MANYKIVTLKDPTTGEYLIPRVPRSLAYDVLDDGTLQGPIEMDADTLGGHPASDFLLKSEYTPVDLSGYLQTSVADTKYALITHTHTADQVSAGTLGGAIVAQAAAVAALGTKQVRNIYAGTADLTAGSSPLPAGDIYLVYE